MLLGVILLGKHLQFITDNIEKEIKDLKQRTNILLIFCFLLLGWIIYLMIALQDIKSGKRIEQT